MNTVICTMSLSLPPAFSSVALMSLKICRTCPSRSPASDLPESSTTASRELPGQPHDLAALGDHRLRVAARLRTLALEELLGVQRSSEAEQQRRRDEADESASGCHQDHLRLPDLRGLCRGYHVLHRAHLPTRSGP